MQRNSKLLIALRQDKWFGILVDGRERIRASAFSDDRRTLVRRFARFSRNLTPIQGDHWLLNEMVKLYDGGDSSRTIELDFGDVSGFQTNVYRILKKIPRGKVASYGSISAALGSGPRAVGTAVACNRFAPFVPCHRVIPVDMTIGNYSMNGKPDSEGSNVKRQLLEREGVIFDGDRIDESCLWKPKK